jgi:NADPH:quinone reductase-like Zn-dependent oxidoreductase
MPLILGNERCGEVIEVGERVAKGDAGAFAEIAAVPATPLAKVPGTVSDTDAG